MAKQGTVLGVACVAMCGDLLCGDAKTSFVVSVVVSFCGRIGLGVGVGFCESDLINTD